MSSTSSGTNFGAEATGSSDQTGQAITLGGISMGASSVFGSASGGGGASGSSYTGPTSAASSTTPTSASLYGNASTGAAASGTGTATGSGLSDVDWVLLGVGGLIVIVLFIHGIHGGGKL